MNKYCFVITSCIYPTNKPLSYSDIRSIFTPKERLEQTKKTIDSIREKCPDAEIILVDNGNAKIPNIKGVDKQIYLGDHFLFRLTSNSMNKSLGEVMMLLYVCKFLDKSYEYIFKISGRYWLNDYFNIENFKHDAFTFLHLLNNDPEIFGMHDFVSGIHSTRLYGFPGKCVKEYKRSLRKSVKDIYSGKSIEEAWPRYIQYQLYYTKRLGVSGYIGVDKDWKDE